MGEITGRGLSGETHRRRTLGLSDNPIGEFYPTLLHLNPWGNVSRCGEEELTPLILNVLPQYIIQTSLSLCNEEESDK